MIRISINYLFLIGPSNLNEYMYINYDLQSIIINWILTKVARLVLVGLG